MRRRIGVVMAVLALLGVASGCSLREVQLWFKVNKQQDITRAEAKTIADAVNAKKAPGGCDGNYAGGCVPDNATSVHCAATTGDGPEVRGPLTVTGWDSFELDADGDKNVCVDPAGNLETFGQLLDRVVARGWAFDPNTVDPINVDIADDGTTTRVLGNIVRPDVNTVYAGVGPAHGFEYSAAAVVGESRPMCVTGVDVGVGSDASIGCKLVTVLDVGSATHNAATVTGLLEGADRVPGGVHVRGFTVQSGAATITIAGNVGDHVPTLAKSTVLRPDVDTFLTVVGATGFDFLLTDSQIPTTAAWVCLEYSGLSGTTDAGSAGNVSCRSIGT